MDFLKQVIYPVRSTYSKVKFFARKHSPEILVGVGLFCAGASVILAGIESTKIKPILDSASKEIVEIHDNIDKKNDNYPAEQGKRDLRRVYSKTTFKVVKLYAPTALTFSLSVASILGAHHITVGRNAALAAALTSVENGYRAYRNRVKEQYGEEAEYNLYHNVTENKIVETIKDENGKNKKVTKTEKVVNETPDYTTLVFSRESSRAWQGNPVLDKLFLYSSMNALNNKLRYEHVVFLADIYKMLEIRPEYLTEAQRRASHIIGWLYRPGDDRYDNVVSFGLEDPYDKPTNNAVFVDNDGKLAWMLEFNFDGDIINSDKYGHSVADTK
jgi:hypothetical protein